MFYRKLVLLVLVLISLDIVGHCRRVQLFWARAGGWGGCSRQLTIFLNPARPLTARTYIALPRHANFTLVPAV